MRPPGASRWVDIPVNLKVVGIWFRPRWFLALISAGAAAVEARVAVAVAQAATAVDRAAVAADLAAVAAVLGAANIKKASSAVNCKIPGSRAKSKDASFS